ncbi:hypothetical protein HWV62_14192 [Athelia sp. TMB]|nr:hypothetical protein HWV62_14192 [Athelia sp. TMB]
MFIPTNTLLVQLLAAWGGLFEASQSQPADSSADVIVPFRAVNCGGQQFTATQIETRFGDAHNRNNGRMVEVRIRGPLRTWLA